MKKYKKKTIAFGINLEIGWFVFCNWKKKCFEYGHLQSLKYKQKRRRRRKDKEYKRIRKKISGECAKPNVRLTKSNCA